MRDPKRCVASRCKNQSRPGKSTCDDVCAAVRAEYMRVYDSNKATRPPKLVQARPCLRPGCPHKARPRKQTCSDDCASQTLRGWAETVRKANQQERAELRQIDTDPVSDGYYCGGCRWLRACPGSERQVKCARDKYPECAPWTGSPRLKERA
jgi:hypothetical protein